MQYQPWAEGHGTVDLGRMFEYTAGAVKQRFQHGNDPALDKLIQLPCLFMQEGTDNQVARVGRITDARISGGQVAFEYMYYSDVPSILNSHIYANKAEFDMSSNFEFSRNHWAVKELDLFRMLLRNAHPRRQRPTIFTLPDHENIDPALASAMMPFDAAFSAVFTSLKTASEAVGLRCRRADDMWENASIIADIVSLIDKSFVVICDCTGRNPNVFYEIGIAHTLGREVILITQSDADIPFDLRHLRYVKYLNNFRGACGP